MLFCKKYLCDWVTVLSQQIEWLGNFSDSHFHEEMGGRDSRPRSCLRDECDPLGKTELAFSCYMDRTTRDRDKWKCCLARHICVEGLKWDNTLTPTAVKQLEGGIADHTCTRYISQSPASGWTWQHTEVQASLWLQTLEAFSARQC